MKHHDAPTPSKAAVAGHPLHPIFVAFPIAFLVGAFVTDIAFLSTGDPFWARVSVWLIGAGLAAGLLAALFGLIDFLGRPYIREHAIAWWHLALNGMVMIVTAANLYVRLNGDAGVVFPVGLVFSAAVAALLAASGWLGGEMSFKHKFGVVPDIGDHETTPADELESERYHAMTAGD